MADKKKRMGVATFSSESWATQNTFGAQIAANGASDYLREWSHDNPDHKIVNTETVVTVFHKPNDSQHRTCYIHTVTITFEYEE